MWIPTEAGHSLDYSLSLTPTQTLPIYILIFFLFLAGKVIGKKGSVITHLQRTTQSEVIVLTIPEVGSELWSPVVITGEPLRALQAYELIKDIVEGS